MGRASPRQAGLDDLDRAIMDGMRSDGRRTYADVAKELCAPEATVRKRFQRLVREGYLQITGWRRLEQSEAAYDVSIAMKVTPGSLWSVAQAVAELEPVRFVSITTGTADVQLAANFKTSHELLEFLAGQLGRLPGIESIQTRQILRHVKRDTQFLPNADDASPTSFAEASESLPAPPARTGRRRAQKGALDDLDRAIVRALQVDGRRSYAELAKALCAPEATVRKRFQRLVREGYLQIIVMSRLERTAATYNMMISVRAAPDAVLDVAEALAAIESVRWVAIVTGEADILLTANFATNKELLDFLSNRLGAISGVKSTQTNQVLHYVRRNYRWIAED